MKTEIEVTNLQVKDAKVASQPPEAGGGAWDRFSQPQKPWTLPTPGSLTSVILELAERQ